MCGISFYCSLKGHMESELCKSMSSILHRGPDAQGTYFSKVQKYFVGFGHNRLSIIDLTESANQPMTIGEGLTLSYNGEVYNFKELRALIERQGVRFNGHSDTEVILRLYDCYGTKSFAMLKGMFAFVLLDESIGKLFIVRDAVGVKPLYLYEDEQQIIGSSEIKGLKAFNSVDCAIDKDDIFEFFNNGFLYEPSTGYRNIKKLMPGHYYELNLNSGNKSEFSFNNFNSLESSEKLKEKIKKSLDCQIIADVPLGVFFSGGVDSSILASYTKNRDLFFAKYDSDPSSDVDLKYSKLISRYLEKNITISELHSNKQNVEELLASVDFVARNSEELISDYTFWPTYQLSMAAKEKGYKVMLSGMGGDEVFAGYPRYLVLKSHKLIKILSPVLKLLLVFKFFPKKLNKKFERLVSYSSEKKWAVAYSRLLGYFSKSELSLMFSEHSKLEAQFSSRLDSIEARYKGNNKDKVKLAQFFDMYGFLSHNLMVSDKASMLAGIEVRVPLLDESIVAHGLGLPSKGLINKGKTKYPLKEILAELIPSGLIERPKTGFNPPLDGLIDTIGKDRLKYELSCLSGVLNEGFIYSLIESHFSKKSNNTYKLWQLLYFSRWIKANNL